MKKLSIALLLVLLVPCSAALAQYGTDEDRISPENAKALEEISEKYAPELYTQQGQIMGKRAELMGMLSRKNVDRAKAEKLAAEIGDLMSKSFRQRVSMMLEMREKGIPFSGSCLMGMGYCGGGGMGYGMMDDDNASGWHGGMMGRGMHGGGMSWRGMMGY